MNSAMRFVAICGMGLVSVVVAAGYGGSQRVEPAVPKPVPDAWVLYNNSFAFELYGKLAAHPGNLLFSPQSVSMALAAVSAGAQGNMAAQIHRGAHLYGDAEQIKSNFAGWLDLLDETVGQGGALENTSHFWYCSEYPVSKAYLDLLDGYFWVDTQSVDTAGKLTDGTLLNNWAAKTTGNAIGEFLKGKTGTDTRLVLANALRFRNEWRDAFKTSDTREEPFYTSPDHAVPCQLMRKKGVPCYADTETMQVVELGFRGPFSFLIILPKRGSSLPEVERILLQNGYQTWLSAVQYREVEVCLPRFQADYTAGLEQPLSRMGMPDLCEKDGDFSGMLAPGSESAGNPAVGAMESRSFFRVDESGIEAASVTAISLEATPKATESDAVSESPSSSAPVVRADRPFLFLVEERTTASLLFLGRVVNPGVSENAS